MEQQPTTHENTSDRKVVVTVPEALLTSLRTTCAEKDKVSLLGRIQGKHPGLKALTAWARDTLHPTLTLLSLKANNLFEISFSDPEGRVHALTQTELTCETATISFSSWRLHYAVNNNQDNEQLDFPVWLQIVDLSQILRNDTFLRTIGAHIGQVIAIDNSEAYRAKLFGPRIRILVSDINNLPQSVVLPRIDGEGEVEYQLEYSGLPNQCGRCRALDHHVRHCPRKDFRFQRRENQVRSKHLHPATETKQPTVQQKVPARQEPLTENRGGATPHQGEPLVATQEAAAPEAEKEQPLTTELSAQQLKDDSPNNSEPEPSQTIQVTPTRQTQPQENRSGTPPHPLAYSIRTTQPSTSSELPSLEEERPHSPDLNVQKLNSGIPPELQPNEINFPQLTSPGVAIGTPPHSQISQPPSTPHTFVWRRKTATEEPHPDKDKGKLKTPGPDSVPLTRQGYRSGRLAEDFWTVLNIPNTPTSSRKKLRVIPFLTKNQTHAEHLANKSKPYYTPITTVHIAELLAGIPWTLTRVRQHVITEVSQALHKILIFNNQSNSPIYKWEQGQWFSYWVREEEEHICTLYVTIPIPESKLKIRKGRDFGWMKIPEKVQEALVLQPTEAIQEVVDSSGWQTMITNKELGNTSTTPKTNLTPTSTTEQEGTSQTYTAIP